MTSVHKNKSTQCDDSGRNFAVEGVCGFSTDRVFKSRQDLMDWVQNVGRSLGYVIVTRRSKNKPSGYMSKVILMCDRGGICRSKSSIRIARNKKINCPFELVGKYYKMHDFWTLTVICEKHNHEPIRHMEGHPYARRLSKDDARLVLDLSKKNVKPQEILSTLKEKNTNNFSTMRTIYNALQKFRKTGNAEVSMGQTTNCEENASTSSVYAFDGNKLKRAIDCTDRFGILNTCEKKTFVKQPVNNVKSVSANPMRTARTFDVNKSERTIDHMDQFSIPNTCETQTFMEKPINHEDGASLNTMYTGYAFDANKSTRTIDYMNSFSVPNSSEIRTFMGQPIKCEEGASSSPVYTAYTFDADTSKGTTDHMDPFAVENWVQEVYSAKYGSTIKDVEDHLLRKQMMQRRFLSLQTDLIETNPVKDISIANLVRDAVMCHDTSVPDAALIAVSDDNEPAFARPFQPYRDIILNKPDGQFLMKQFLEDGYAHDQFSMGNSGGEGECVEENLLNTAVESVDKDDKDRNIDSDVEVAKKHDKGEYVGVQPDSKQMASFHPNKSTHGDEYERNLSVKGTSGFSTNELFKSRQDLMDWVQNVGRSLGYVIVTRRSKSKPSGYVSKVMLMCDRGGICKSKSSIRTTRSKKINCPFELVGKYYKVNDVWTLDVICEKHNHEPALDMEGHPYAMRLSKDEARLVVDLSNKNVKPQEILSVLKEQNTNNLSTMRTIYNARQKFRRIEHAENSNEEISMGLPINDEESASPSPVYTEYVSDANKSESTIDHTDPSRILNTYEITFMEQSIKNVESASTNPMHTAYILDSNKSKRTIDHMDPFTNPNSYEITTFKEQLINSVESASMNPMCSTKAFDASKSKRTMDLRDSSAIRNTCEIKTFMEQPINNEESAYRNPMYTAYTFDANKLTRSIDFMDPFAIPNSCEIKTFMGQRQPIKREDGVSPSPLYTAYAFGADKSKRTI